MNETFISLKNVNKEFKTPGGSFQALKSIDLDISRGDYIGIAGKSGSGKTTLLNMITGIDHPTSGEITIGGQRIDSGSENRTAVWRGRNVGIVFQFFQLLPTLSVLENVMLPMDFCGIIPTGMRKSRAEELLERTGVISQAHKLPSSLSGGEQQRAAIARALANNPEILAADEPTGNLDSQNAEMVYGIFEALVKEGKTVILISHDREIAKRVNRTIFIADGKIENLIQ